jgi:hypothetical protein
MELPVQPISKIDEGMSLISRRVLIHRLPISLIA